MKLIEQLGIDLMTAPRPRGRRSPLRPDAALLTLWAEGAKPPPVLVWPSRSSTVPYEVLRGSQIWRTAQHAQIPALPAVVWTDCDDESARALVEADRTSTRLPAIEMFSELAALCEVEGVPLAQAAAWLGISRSHAAHLRRLRRLPNAVLAMVESGQLSVGHAKALVSVPPNSAKRLATSIERHGWSVREVERQAQRHREGPTAVSKSTDADMALDADTRRLIRVASAATGLQMTLDGRRASFDYGGNLEVLQGLLERLGIADQLAEGLD